MNRFEAENRALRERVAMLERALIIYRDYARGTDAIVMQLADEAQESRPAPTDRQAAIS